MRQTLTLLALATLLLAPAAPLPAAVYEIQPEESELVVRTFRGGIASAFAHDHVARATELSGSLRYDPNAPADAAVEVVVPSASVRVDEPEARERFGLPQNVSESQREEIQETMEGPDQLDVARFPEISFRSTRVAAAADGELEVTGTFTLHGVSREVTLPVRVEIDGETVRAEGAFRFQQSDHGIKPFSAGLGTVRNRDEVEMMVRLVARR